jgi:hypothetical protein
MAMNRGYVRKSTLMPDESETNFRRADTMNWTLARVPGQGRFAAARAGQLGRDVDVRLRSAIASGTTATMAAISARNAPTPQPICT